jgi:excisionase family DNA binding protein
MNHGQNAKELLYTEVASHAPARGPAPGGERLTISIGDACRICGISRSELYRRLADGQIGAVKSGARTLIVMESLRRHIASLPRATFRKPG